MSDEAEDGSPPFADLVSLLQRFQRDGDERTAIQSIWLVADIPPEAWAPLVETAQLNDVGFLLGSLGDVATGIADGSFELPNAGELRVIARLSRSHDLSEHDDRDETADGRVAPVSKARRRVALQVARRVAKSFRGQVVLEELPDDAPFSPACSLTTLGGSHLATVSSNAVATTLLVGPARALVELPDDLDEPSRAVVLEATLRAAVEQQLRAA